MRTSGLNCAKFPNPNGCNYNHASEIKLYYYTKQHYFCHTEKKDANHNDVILLTLGRELEKQIHNRK
jgi:hypothetical protein